VLTVSDTRTEESDTSGALIRDLLAGSGHRIVAYQIVRDEPIEIRNRLGEWTTDHGVDAILTNGGTGIANRDTTYDVIAGLLEKRIDGFGELFRMLSFAEIGAAAMLSRAVAGVCRGRVIVAMPGSTNAVRLAMERLVVPELAHMVYELRK
jgi:molybdenum cofactor biosynthesis protein B